MIEFDNINMLWIMVVIPFVFLIHYFTLVHFKKKAFKFANFETLKRLSDQEKGISKNVTVLALRVLFLIVFAFALSGIGIEITQTGISDQIVFAIDVSGSMLANDVAPTRLEASKTVVKDFIENVSVNSKVGLVTFTSIVYLEQEMTDDVFKFKTSVDQVDVRKTTGTSLGNTISFSSSLFDSDDELKKSIVILTDGQENFMNEEELIDITEHVASRNIHVFVLGVGSDVGGAFAEDLLGKSVINEDSIEIIATTSQGKYIIAENRPDMMQALRTFFAETEFTRIYSISFWLYLICFVILMFEWYFINYFSRAFP